MGGLLDVIVGAGATIGKIFSAVSSIVSQENTLTHSYVDKVTGENKVLNSTGLSIAGGDFIVEKNQNTGEEVHEIFNTSSDNSLLVTRSNVDEVTGSAAIGETLQIPATQKISIDGFYNNAHYPLETVIEVTPQQKLQSFVGATLSSEHVTYMGRFKNIPVGGPEMKSGSYFQLAYQNGAFIFVNPMVTLLGVSYFEVSSHNGVYFRNTTEMALSPKGANYELTYDLSKYGVKDGDTIDVGMTVVIESNNAQQLLNQQSIQPKPLTEDDKIFLSQLRNK